MTTWRPWSVSFIIAAIKCHFYTCFNNTEIRLHNFSLILTVLLQTHISSPGMNVGRRMRLVTWHNRRTMTWHQGRWKWHVAHVAMIDSFLTRPLGQLARMPIDRSHTRSQDRKNLWHFDCIIWRGHNHERQKLRVVSAWDKTQLVMSEKSWRLSCGGKRKCRNVSTEAWGKKKNTPSLSLLYDRNFVLK